MVGGVILHIDLDSHFASAEILKNSALEGQPVVMAGLHRRSVISTASYEARKYGVRGAIPLHMATGKCPNLVVVQGDYGWYEELSNRFFKYLCYFSSLIEPVSIGKYYMDVTDVVKDYKRPLDLAWQTQKSVQKDLKLPHSIGVASNKFLAKTANNIRKPMGVTILHKQEVLKRLWPLPTNDMWGIGKKTVPLLIKHGITTIGNLADVGNESEIMALLGKHAYTYIQNARGSGNAQLSFNISVQSISQSTTLNRNITNYERVKTVLKRLAAILSRRAREDHIKGSLIFISIHYFDLINTVRSTNIHSYTDDANVLLERVLLLFNRHYNGREIRHLGVGLGSLYSAGYTISQIDLFQHEIQLLNDVGDVLRKLNAQLPGAHLIRASDIRASKGQK